MDTLPPDQTASVRHDTPLDLEATLAPLRQGGFDPSMRLSGPIGGDRGARALVAFHTPDGPATLLLDHELDADSEPGLVAGLRPCGRVHGAAWGPGSAWALERLADLVGLEDDPSSFTPSNPLIRRLHRHRLGVRLVRTHRVADLLAPTVLAQLVTGREALMAWRRLVRRFGEPAPGPDPTLLLPPAMDVLARLSLGEYVREGVIAKQGATVQRLARESKILDGTAGMAAQDAYLRLTSIPGIGPWTAASVMVSGMGFADAVAVGDFHYPNVVAWNLAGEPRADDARMLELLEPFRPHRGRVIRLLLTGGRAAPKFGPRVQLRDMNTW